MSHGATGSKKEVGLRTPSDYLIDSHARTNEKGVQITVCKMTPTKKKKKQKKKGKKSFNKRSVSFSRLSPACAELVLLTQWPPTPACGEVSHARQDGGGQMLAVPLG